MKPEIERFLVVSAVLLILFVAAMLLVGLYFSAAWLMAEYPDVTALLFMCWLCYGVLRDVV
jgi:phage shock protein PspC (stress-responsive transcriptional regulator)